MLTVYLFAVFLFAYAWIVTPSRKTPVPVPVAEIITFTVTADDPAFIPPMLREPKSAPKEISPIPTLTITPEELEDIAPSAPNFASMGCVALRRECSARGIKWRVRKGKGKGNYAYLTVEEMIEALS